MGIGAEELRDKTDELAGMIRKHPLARRHERLLAEINADESSRGLLHRLINLGAMIDRTARAGKEAGMDADEKAELENSLKANPNVQAYIETRRELVALLAAVMERVRNPEPGG